MKKWNKAGKLTIKLCILFLLVVLPLTLFSILVFSLNYSSLRGKAVNSIDNSVEMIAIHLDEALQGVFYAQNMLNVDDSILYMMNGTKIRTSDYQQYLYLKDVLNNLNNMQNSQPLIREIRLHIPSLDKTFLSNGTITRLSDECKTLEDTMNSFMQIGARDDYLAITCGYPWFTDGEFPYYLVTEIDCQKIVDDILNLFTGEFGNVYIYHENEDQSLQLITCNGTKSLFEAWKAEGVMPEGVGEIIIDNSEYLVSREYVSFFDIGVLALAPRSEVFYEINVQSRIMLIVLILTVILILLFILIILRMINDPLHRLADAFALVQMGHFDTEIKNDSKDEFGEIYSKFNAMTSQMKRLIDDNYNSKLLVQDTKLRQLQAQINPHFLYNSLRFIYAMAQIEDYDGIQEFSMKLSSFYHYTAKRNTEPVTVRQEDEYARAYLEIQGMRFEDRLELRLQKLPQELYEEPAPHFSIQTMAENAIKYALPTQPENGIIALSYRILEKGYCVALDDNGTGMTDEKLNELGKIITDENAPDSGTGLFNLQTRLKLRWGSNAYLRFGRSELGGMRVEMYILWRNEQ